MPDNFKRCDDTAVEPLRMEREILKKAGSSLQNKSSNVCFYPRTAEDLFYYGE